VSPILFAIYLSGVFQAIERAVPGLRTLSFADDVGLIVPASSVAQACEKLQQAGETAIEWGLQDDVQFDAQKTEAVLFTRKRGWQLRDQAQRAQIVIDRHQVEFSQEATRWLGIWLDSGLTLKAHYQTCLRKARTAEARLRSLCRTEGLAPGLVRRIQVAAVQAVALYGAELWWQGQKDRQAHIQLLINRQARATIGALRSTPVGPLLREAGLEPAESVLNARQLGYTRRLLGLPSSHPGHQILLCNTPC
jgi:Reverse transcriptase (RNA-dependent DNA polymerase)